jgi:hypothetical protein
MRSPALKLLVALLSAVLALAAIPASACSGPAPIPFRQHFARASHVFVFRLESATLVSSMTSTVRGRIRVVETLKGKTPAFRTVEFSTGSCGGMRLDVGHYYLALASRNGEVMTLEGGDRSVLDLRWQYDEDVSKAINHRQEILRTIDAALAGKPLPKDFPSVEALQFTQYTAPPPIPGEAR